MNADAGFAAMAAHELRANKSGVDELVAEGLEFGARLIQFHRGVVQFGEKILASLLRQLIELCREIGAIPFGNAALRNRLQISGRRQKNRTARLNDARDRQRLPPEEFFDAFEFLGVGLNTELLFIFLLRQRGDAIVLSCDRALQIVALLLIQVIARGELRLFEANDVLHLVARDGRCLEQLRIKLGFAVEFRFQT